MKQISFKEVKKAIETTLEYKRKFRNGLSSNDIKQAIDYFTDMSEDLRWTMYQSFKKKYSFA
jgi:hypothetical protein